MIRFEREHSKKKWYRAELGDYLRNVFEEQRNISEH